MEALTWHEGDANGCVHQGSHETLNDGSRSHRYVRLAL